MTQDENIDNAIIKNLEFENDSSQFFVTKGDKRTLFKKMDAYEKNIIKEAMKECRTTREIANYLGICQASVVRKIAKHNLKSNS